MIRIATAQSYIWEISSKYAKPWRKKARKGEIYQAKNIVDERSNERTKF